MVTFCSDAPCLVCRETISCTVTKIMFAHNIEDVCDWDDRVKYVRWVDIEPEPPEK